MDDKADYCFFGTTHSLCCDPGEGYEPDQSAAIPRLS